MDAIVR